MSRLMLAILIAASATSAGAISRYESKRLSCDQIHSAIETQGAVILRYPSPRVRGLTLYDRYVSDGGYCASHQVTERVTIPARGGEFCYVDRCKTRPDHCEGRGETCF